MSLTELGLLFAVLAHSVAVITAAIKLVAWIVKKQAVTDERMDVLQKNGQSFANSVAAENGRNNRRNLA